MGKDDVTLVDQTHEERDIDQLPDACSGGSSVGVAVCDGGEKWDEAEGQNETSSEEEVSSPVPEGASGPSPWASWTCPVQTIGHCQDNRYVVK